MIDAKLQTDLIRDEGRKLVSYQDSVKHLWTIGIGHLIGEVRRMISITSRECDALYVADVEDAVVMLRRACSFTRNDDWPKLEPARWRALVNMTFNRGPHMVTSSNITPAINLAAVTGDWSPVGPAITHSEWASEIGARAIRLRDALLTGGA